MAITLHPHAAGSHHRELRPGAALRQAWYWYITLLFIPFVMAMIVIITLNSREETPANTSVIIQGGHGVNYRETVPAETMMTNTWFMVAIGFMLLAGPAAFVVRSRLFRSYWRGEAVAPRDYLLGMLVVWITFEIGGLLSLTGCLMSNSLLPCLLPALAAFMFFTPLWPNGRAMAHPTGNTDDPEIYQEPR